MTATRVAPAEFPRLRGNDARRVIATLGSLAGPAESGGSVPAWLRPEQIRPFHQVMAALERHGAAFLALPVGTGKSFIALAAARAAGHAAANVVGPAVLEAQWLALGRRLGVGVSFVSNDRISRGRSLPGRGFVIVDECHHFRHPGTRRYRALQPAMAGRAVLLLSATPIVNQPADLAAQLALAFRDDALAPAGLTSLAEGLAGPDLPAAVESLLIGSIRQTGFPELRATTAPDWGTLDARLAPVVDTIDRLRLSREAPISALLRSSLFRALASSPAALLASIRRYRRLLDHAARARRAGHPVHRATIRSVIDPAPEQLVMWELLDPSRIASDLALADRAPLERLDAQVSRWMAEGDGKTALLRTILADRRPTVVFAGSVATVHHLRRVMCGTGTAWVTGDGAGIGSQRIGRAIVLRWFGPQREERPGIPWLLLASDVAAEGLDLQGAARAIHYDIPWTAVRLGQRDGRIVRLGSTHREAEVIRLPVPALIEDRLGLEAAVERKAALGAKLRHRMDVTGSSPGGAASTNGWATFESPPGEEAGGFVAGYRLERGGSAAGSLVIANTARAGWSEDPAVVARLLGGPNEPAVDEEPDVTPILEALESKLVERLRHLNGSLLARRRSPAARSARRIGTEAGFITARLQAIAIFRPAAGSTTLPG